MESIYLSAFARLYSLVYCKLYHDHYGRAKLRSMRDHRELEVWQKAMDVAAEVYVATKSLAAEA
jgi:hypothetical protein